jgi:two-component system sensor histidine kinase/response regulator
MSASQGRARFRAVAWIVLISIIVSELITIVLTRVLLGEVLAEGMLIALVCATPISAWIADTQIRMRHLISQQRDQLSTLNLELEARNADLDAFARGVAHDLKNPLTAIIGMADLLSGDPQITAIDDAAESVKAILQSGDRANEIIDGLLLLHGIQHESLSATSVDTDATIDTALETLAGAVAAHQAVVTRSAALPTVKAHSPWLIQVWINLIGNAIKYGGSPPTVDVVAHMTSDEMVRFDIRDNGTGIAPDDRERIFNEFERATNTDIDGHGLGLAIVNRVVDRLGGETGVDSAPSGGSVFWFTVPAA